MRWSEPGVVHGDDHLGAALAIPHDPQVLTVVADGCCHRADSGI